MKAFPHGALLILLGGALGFYANGALRSVHETTIRSNRHALETSLIEALEKEHAKGGRYPQSLADVAIDWLEGNSPRREMLLEVFYYRSSGTDYTLWWPGSSLPRSDSHQGGSPGLTD